MKKKLSRYLLLFSTFLIITTFTTGCSTNTKSDNVGPIINPITVNISIDYPKKSKLNDIENIPFTCEEDSTIIDVIQLYCNVNEIPVAIETTFGNILAINNITSGYYDNKRQWIFFINDTPIDKDNLNKSIVKDGDNINCSFITKKRG